MLCTLMHKRIAVAELDIDDASGTIQKINSVYNEAHLPMGVLPSNGIIDRTALNEWWTDRSIPASRSGIRETLETLEIASTKILPLRSFGLSLSDHYWVCPQGSGLTWDQINFFENSFSDDIGDILFGEQTKNANFDFYSPDNTSDGFLKKRWKIINGERCLIKGGSNPFWQQPFNEVIAAEIMKRLQISHVPYRLVWDNGYPYSVCADFVTPNTELVSAWRVSKTSKSNNSDSKYQHLVKCCENLGVSDIVQSLDEMLVLDYIIGNEDRHMNNFGLLRDPDTLQWIGMAPVFDSGSSLGYDRTAGQIADENKTPCKPFKKTHEEQIKLVSSFEWVDFQALSDIDKWIYNLFDERALEFVGNDRVNSIVQTVQTRIEQVHDMAMTHRFTTSHVERDLTDNHTMEMTL